MPPSSRLSCLSLRNLVKKRKCPAYLIPSRPFLGRCVPTFGLVRSSANLTRSNVERMQTQDGSQVDSEKLKEGVKYLMELIDLRGTGERLLSDFAGYWWILLLGLVFAMLISFGWIMLLRLATKLVVWLSIVVCVVLLLTATSFSFYKYSDLLAAGDNADQDDIFLPPVISSLSSYYYNKNTWLGLGIILAVITLIVILVLMFLFTRIQIAIELLEEASKAVGEMPATLFFPLGPFLIQIVVLGWFVLVGMFLATSGTKEYKVVDADTAVDCINPQTGTQFVTNEKCDPTTFPSSCGQNCPAEGCPQCVFHKFGPSLADSWFQVLNFFGLFWLLFFVAALGEMVLAGAFAGWYWTLDKAGPMDNVGVMQSLARTCRYHLGTLAFGSLILSVARMIRVLLEYIEDKIKEKGADNPAIKCILCFCKCCFWCLEKFIRFINRNAYIMTAVYGYNFCRGAKKSFTLLASNAARALVLDKVTDFILFLGKIIVVTIVSAVSFSLFSTNVSTALDLNINYQLVPMAIIILGSYAIASTFFSVYSMAVDTIFLCFLEDIDKHDGSAESPYFMNEDLLRILEIKEDKNE